MSHSAMPAERSQREQVLHANAGFTLIELLIAVLVLAVLVALGVPSMNEFIANQRTTQAANQLLADLAYARTQALVLQRPVRLSANAGGWSQGWDVVSDGNVNGAIDGVGRLADEQYREQEPLPDGFLLALTENGGAGRTDIWFDRLGAGAVTLPGNVTVDFPVRFLFQRPDSNADRAATLCLGASGVAIVRKGTTAC